MLPDRASDLMLIRLTVRPQSISSTAAPITDLSVRAALMHCLIDAITFGTSYRYIKTGLFVMLCFESF